MTPHNHESNFGEESNRPLVLPLFRSHDQRSVFIAFVCIGLHPPNWNAHKEVQHVRTSPFRCA